MPNQLVLRDTLYSDLIFDFIVGVTGKVFLPEIKKRKKTTAAKEE